MSTEKSLPRKNKKTLAPEREVCTVSPQATERVVRALTSEGHALVCALGTAALFHALMRDVAVRADVPLDVWTHACDTLTIDDVRAVSDRVRDVVSLGALRVVAVYAARITPDAQHALLKTLEEPPERTRIFLATPTPALLLPTVLSRVALIDLPEPHESRAVGEARAIFALPPHKRLAAVKPLIEAHTLESIRILVREGQEVLRTSALPAHERIERSAHLVAFDEALARGAGPVKWFVEATVLLVP